MTKNSQATSQNRYAPAFSELLPSVKWCSLSNIQSEKLSNWSDKSGIWSKLHTSHDFPFGYYKCETVNSTFFIKVLSGERAKHTEALHSLTKHLIAHQVNCSELIKEITGLNATKESSFPADDCLQIYTYLEGRFSDFTEKDTNLIAENLSLLHKALCVYPKKINVKAKSESDFLAQKNLWKKIQENSLATKNTSLIPDNVLQLLKKENQDLFNVFMIQPQCIHGDLNIGNILINQKNEVCFIDFENAISTWASPLLDIAYVIERNILIPSMYKNISLGSFLSAYFKNTDFKEKSSDELKLMIKEKPSLLSQMLKMMNLRCLLILINLVTRKNESVEESEWKKFISNFQSACSVEEKITQEVIQFFK